MSILSRQYKISLIFVLMLMWKIGINVDAADGDGKTLFCEKFSEINPSSWVSFENMLNLQGFTNLENNDVTMVADRFAYRFDFKQMWYPDRQKLTVKPINYWMPWLENPIKNPLAYAAPFDKNSTNRLDMAYHLYVEKNLFKSYYILVIIAEKSIGCMDMSYPGDALIKEYNPRAPKIKLLTLWNDDYRSRIYAISQIPTSKKEEEEEEEGLIIYQLMVYMGTLFTYKCEPNWIIDNQDLESKPYFYLQLSNDPNNVRLVHPKTGNVTQAKLYPLAERVMPGYMFGKSLYLFDVDLGCVYILTDWKDFDFEERFEKNVDALIPRVNVPFEKFFVCPNVPIEKMFSFLPPDRCETTIGSNTPSMSDRAIHTVPFDTQLLEEMLQDENVEKWTPKLDSDFGSTKSSGLIVSILVVICILVAICLFRIWQQKKKTQSKSKSKSGNNSSGKKNNKNDKKQDEKPKGISGNEKQQPTSSTTKGSLKKTRSVVASVDGGKSGHLDAAKSKLKSNKSTNTTTTTATRTGSSK